MAQIIGKNRHSLIELIKWKDIVLIYFQCIFYNWAILCQTLVFLIQNYVRSKLCFSKFQSLIFTAKTKEIDKTREGFVMTSPRSLSCGNLGDHKYVKLLKVRRCVIFHTYLLRKLPNKNNCRIQSCTMSRKVQEMVKWFCCFMDFQTAGSHGVIKFHFCQHTIAW